jgi:hypothetical protein
MRAPRRLFSGLALVSAVTLALVMSTAALAGGRPLSASMSGAQEVPPADPDGTGMASVWLNQGQGTVCFSFSVEDIALPVTVSHIHVGAAGVAGPPVVPLTGADADGVASGCIADVDPALIKQIRQNPAGYYVNIHNAEFPGGAVRGQLEK